MRRLLCLIHSDIFNTIILLHLGLWGLLGSEPHRQRKVPPSSNLHLHKLLLVYYIWFWAVLRVMKRQLQKEHANSTKKDCRPGNQTNNWTNSHISYFKQNKVESAETILSWTSNCSCSVCSSRQKLIRGARRLSHLAGKQSGSEPALPLWFLSK